MQARTPEATGPCCLVPRNTVQLACWKKTLARDSTAGATFPEVTLCTVRMVMCNYVKYEHHLGIFLAQNA